MRLAIVAIALGALVFTPAGASGQVAPTCIDISVFRQSVNDADTPEIQSARFPEVLRSRREALERCRKLGDRRGEAYALLGAGNAERWLSRGNDAVASLRDALALFRTIGDKNGEAMALNDIGAVFEELDRYNESLRSHQQAFTLSAQLGDRRGQAYSLLGIGNARGALGEFGGAVQALEEAQRLFRILEVKDGFYRTLINLQNVRNDAAAGIDELRTAVADEKNRTSLVIGSTLFVPDDYITTLLELDKQSPGAYAQQAFEIHERKTAREVLKQIADSAAKRFRGVPAEETAAEASAQSAVQSTEASLDTLLSPAAPDKTAVAGAVRAVRHAKANLIELEAAIADKYPAYYELLHPQPVDLNTLQHDEKKGLRPGELLLVYDLLPATSALWVIDRNRIRMFAIAGSDELRDDVAALRGHVLGVLRTERADVERAAADDLKAPRFPAASYALYRKIVPSSVADEVRNATSLVVVPSRALSLLAFEMLVTKDPATTPQRPNYLIDDVKGGVSYAASASLLAVVRGLYARASATRRPLLAFANPTYPAPPAGLRGGAGLSEIPKLPGTDAEARATFARLNVAVDNDNLVEGDEASRQNVVALSRAGTLRSYRYLLFAAHATMRNAIAGLDVPSIILAHPERGIDYGFLTMADILNLSLNADFVALSACDTGIEVPPSGDGISGLTRAFLYAGTPSISVTLWGVDDAAAPLMIPSFFAAMKAGATPAVALRAAKLHMLDSTNARFRHPYAWAPSVIFGDGDTNYGT